MQVNTLTSQQTAQAWGGQPGTQFNAALQQAGSAIQWGGSPMGSNSNNGFTNGQMGPASLGVGGSPGLQPLGASTQMLQQPLLGSSSSMSLPTAFESSLLGGPSQARLRGGGKRGGGGRSGSSSMGLMSQPRQFSSGRVILPTAFATVPLTLTPTPPPTSAPSAAPTFGMPAPQGNRSQAIVEYLKKFPSVDSTTQEGSIKDVFARFEAGDYKDAALHFATGTWYQSNGIIYQVDLSDPASWAGMPSKTRSSWRFVVKSDSVIWVACLAAAGGKSEPESMEVTFNPAGFITKFSKMEPKACRPPGPPSPSTTSAGPTPPAAMRQRAGPPQTFGGPPHGSKNGPS